MKTIFKLFLLSFSMFIFNINVKAESIDIIKDSNSFFTSSIIKNASDNPMSMSFVIVVMIFVVVILIAMTLFKNKS